MVPFKEERRVSTSLVKAQKLSLKYKISVFSELKNKKSRQNRVRSRQRASLYKVLKIKGIEFFTFSAKYAILTIGE